MEHEEKPDNNESEMIKEFNRKPSGACGTNSHSLRMPFMRITKPVAVTTPEEVITPLSEPKEK